MKYLKFEIQIGIILWCVQKLYRQGRKYFDILLRRYRSALVDIMCHAMATILGFIEP